MRFDLGLDDSGILAEGLYDLYTRLYHVKNELCKTLIHHHIGDFQIRSVRVNWELALPCLKIVDC
ncbi:hypothetical protein BDW59DRAFT_150769 [Aspergillus cavernicola]|uniref:Uncharacterized protein n=1 Tax=Aspergillus cavernicola TaxID=176166 RepID=A0ABR4HYB2_9EURO